MSHVVCGQCNPETYLCGTQRDADEEIFALPKGVSETLCAVCFAPGSVTCTSCGSDIAQLAIVGPRRDQYQRPTSEERTLGLVWVFALMAIVATIIIGFATGGIAP